jgi:hypothetical protein
VDLNLGFFNGTFGTVYVIIVSNDKVTVDVELENAVGRKLSRTFLEILWKQLISL